MSVAFISENNNNQKQSRLLNLLAPLVISANMSVLFILHVLILFCATEIHASLPRFVVIVSLHLLDEKNYTSELHI